MWQLAARKEPWFVRRCQRVEVSRWEMCMGLACLLLPRKVHIFSDTYVHCPRPFCLCVLPVPPLFLVFPAFSALFPEDFLESIVQSSTPKSAPSASGFLLCAGFAHGISAQPPQKKKKRVQESARRKNHHLPDHWAIAAPHLIWRRRGRSGWKPCICTFGTFRAHSYSSA